MWWHDRAGTSAPTDVVLALLSAGAAYEVAVMLGKAGKPASIPTVVLVSAALAGLGLVAPHSPGIRSQVRALLVAGAVVCTFVRHLRAVQPGDLDRLLATLFPI